MIINDISYFMEMVKSSLILFFISIVCSCNAQSKLPYDIKKIEESIWVPKTDAYQKVNYDSTLTLIFQKYFDDSISIYVDDSLLFNDFYKTDPSTVVVQKFNKIKGTVYNVGKEVRINLIGKKEYVEFKIKAGYKYAYLTREKSGKWYVEYSEYKRKYY